MNLKTIYNKITKDIHAVSPVVATLVLIIVAIIGAAAVGAMTGAFTDDVGGQEADIAITGGSLIIGGSSTVYPAGVQLARGFMTENPGVRITVQGGGSGAGIAAVGRDVIDIGMSSRIGGIDSTEAVQFPALVNRVVHIGNSTVLLIGNIGINQTELNNITRIQLQELFVNGRAITIDRRNATTGALTGETRTLRGVFREDRSGTASEFAGLVGGGATEDSIRTIAAAHPTNITLRNGNPGVFEAIRTTADRIGGVDMGFADTTLIRRTMYVNQTRDRPLNMITHGEPSRLEQAFLDYARSPGAISHFTIEGVRSLYCPAPVFSATP